MKQIKILLVDDEEDLVRTLSERMNMRNFGTDIALNGEAALKLVENEVPDVMVLDLKMPGIDGMEVLRRIKNIIRKFR
jgi:DNA-binding response OmpR family regulator